MKKIIDKNNYYSVTEASKLLDISRTAVLKRINSGKLKAERIGYIFAIPKTELGVSDGKLTDSEKKVLDAGIKKTFKDYGEVIRKLGRE